MTISSATKAAFAAVLFAVAASSAFAQSPPPPPLPGAGAPAQAQPMAPAGPEARGPESRGDDDRAPGRHFFGGPREHHRMAMRHMRHHRGDKDGASFNFERGDSSVRIKCDDDEPMKACADAAVQLLDKLGSMSR